MKGFISIIILGLIGIGIFCFCLELRDVLDSEKALAAEMTSDNYRIWFSDINVGGSDYQTTDNYIMRDTIGGFAPGESTSTNYKLKAGYQQLPEGYISVTVPASGLAMDQPGNMSITVDTVTNASAGAVWNVKTDNPAGYTLSFKSATTDCLLDDNYSPAERFTDYTESSPGTPDSWSVDADFYEFGFSVFGNDAPDATWGTGSDCTSPASNNLKYRGFEGTTLIQVASSSSRTSTSGTDTALCVAVEQNNVYAPSGSYSATITATAVTQ